MKTILPSTLEKKINALPYNVILRSDISKLGSSDQLTYALNKLIKEKKIARIGYGIYAKVKILPFGEKKVFPKSTYGIKGMFCEVLARLNIAWLPSEAEIDYNSGKSTQVPDFFPRIKQKFNKKIYFGKIKFEYDQI